MNKKKQTSNNRQKPRQYSTADRIRLFVVYWLIIFMLVVLGLFSFGRFLPSWAHMLIYASSLVMAGIATFVHVTPGKKSKFDKNAIEEIADELK